jgi:hypothetical protein
MNAGLPGAGIGGLFYLASTMLLPVRTLVRRLRGRSDTVTWRQHAHNLSITIGILGGLWVAGWLLAFVMPKEMLNVTSGMKTPLISRTAIPLAAFGFGVGTLLAVLLLVELAHWMHRPKPAAPAARRTGGP